MLTTKQQLFVQEYLIDANGAAAAIRAGYSDRYPDRQAHILLKNPEVAAAIDTAKDRRSLEIGVDARWILRTLVQEATADLADLFDPETGDIRPVHQWPMIFRTGLVQGLQVEALFSGHGKDRKQIGVVKKLKLDSRIRRKELIGKHTEVAAFQEQVKHNGFDGLGDRIERAYKRLEQQRAPTLDLPVATDSAPQPSEHRPADDESDDEALQKATEAADRYLKANELPTPSCDASPEAEREATVIIAAKPQTAPYSPILPADAWPEEVGMATSDYDPLNEERH